MIPQDRGWAARAGGAVRQEFGSIEENWAAARAVLEGLLPQRRIAVLEAGGGSHTNVGFLKDAEFTVVDISPEQIARNPYATHKLVADLETYTQYPQAYDLIVLNDVLEHMNRPEKALDNLLRHLAPGGFLVVGGPQPTSFKGLFTKFTPHSVHVWFYRAILKEMNAGKPGYAPFKTFLRLSMAPGPLMQRAAAQGLKPAHIGYSYPSFILERMRRLSPLLSGGYTFAMGLLRVITLGQWRPDLTDMVLVFRKAG